MRLLPSRRDRNENVTHYQCSSYREDAATTKQEVTMAAIVVIGCLVWAVTSASCWQW